VGKYGIAQVVFWAFILVRKAIRQVSTGLISVEVQCMSSTAVPVLIVWQKIIGYSAIGIKIHNRGLLGEGKFKVSVLMYAELQAIVIFTLF